MTKQEILNALERITDSLSDQDNRWGIEGVIGDLNLLRNDLENDIIEEDKKWDHKRRIV